jgi:hypothetical protein
VHNLWTGCAKQLRIKVISGKGIIGRICGRPRHLKNEIFEFDQTERVRSLRVEVWVRDSALDVVTLLIYQQRLKRYFGRGWKINTYGSHPNLWLAEANCR